MHRKRKFIKFLLYVLISFSFACGTPLPSQLSVENPSVSSESLFKAHFIDVGQADCTLLEDGELFFMIDTGEKDDREEVDRYLKKCGVKELAGMILTHPHSDHIGLAEYLVKNYKITGKIYMTKETYESPDYRIMRESAEKKKIEIAIPIPGDKIFFGNSRIEFMAPIRDRDDVNDMSIMNKVTYGSNSFFFTGDGGREEERDIIDAGFRIEADVLKVGHHGSDTSSSYLFLREMNPKYAVIFCGKNNSYGHPHKETLSRLHDAETEVYRTDTMGTVVAVSDGRTITFETERYETEEFVTEPPEEKNRSEFNFIGNKNSQVLHTKLCDSLPTEKNRVYFESVQEAVSEGYHACLRCNPK